MVSEGEGHLEIETAKQRLAAARAQASVAAKAQQTAEKMKQYASSNVRTTKRNCEGAQKQFDCVQKEVDVIQREMDELGKRLSKAKSQAASAYTTLETAKSMARNANDMLHNAIRNVDAANSQMQSSREEVDEAQDSLEKAAIKWGGRNVKNETSNHDGSRDEASFTLETAKAISQYASTMLRTVSTEDADEATTSQNRQKNEIVRDKYCVKGADEQWAAVKVKVETDDESEDTETNNASRANEQSKKRRKVSFGTNMTKVFGHDNSSISVAESDATSDHSTTASSKSTERSQGLMSTRTSSSNISVGESDESCSSESSFIRQLASELCNSERSPTYQTSIANSSHYHTITVEAAGVKECNGIYVKILNRTYGGAPVYGYKGYWKGKLMQFVLFCSNAVWYIGAERNKDKALILYRTGRRKHFNSSPPPANGWSIAYEGKFPAPRLRFGESADTTSSSSPISHDLSSSLFTSNAAKSTMSERKVIDNQDTHNQKTNYYSTVCKKTFPSVSVEGGGIQEVNGIYDVAEILQDGSPMYKKKGQCKGKDGSFWIVREWTEYRKNWVISHSPCDSPSSLNLYMVLCDMLVPKEENLMPQKTCWVPHHHGIYPAPRLKW